MFLVEPATAETLLESAPALIGRGPKNQTGSVLNGVSRIAVLVLAAAGENVLCAVPKPQVSCVFIEGNNVPLTRSCVLLFRLPLHSVY